MGRASNRKKARRQAEHRSAQASQSSPHEAAAQQAMLQLGDGAQALGQEMETPREQQADACLAWCGGEQPVAAEEPRWPGGSLGERLCTSTFLARARNAPCLLTADVPDVTVIIADPAHWSVAASVLVRAVVFDGMRVDHPVVSMLLDVLAPIAEAELAHGEAVEAWVNQFAFEEEEDQPYFPELDGPVFLLSTCALMDATRAVVGTDPLREIQAVLLPVLDGAIPGLDGQAVTDALIGAFATFNRCEQPGDADVLARIKRPDSGDALEHLVAIGLVSPRDVLRVGLTVLSALAELCKSGSASILQRVA
jgi:hypothetical protein